MSNLHAVQDEKITVVSCGEEPVAIIRRHSTGNMIIYKLSEMKGEEIADLIKGAQ